MRCWWDNVVFKIHSSEAGNDSQGTGFACHRDEHGAVFLVTCWHVVDKIGRDCLKVGEKKCDLISQDGNDDLDLAVLTVPDLECATPLRLARGARSGLLCETYGFGPQGRPLPIELGGPATHGDGTARGVPAWDYYLGGTARELAQVHPGYSGSPVYDRASRAVVAVLTHRQKSTKGLAIDICNLRRVWTSPPAQLSLPDAPQLALGLRTDLKSMIGRFLGAAGHAGVAERLLRYYAQLAVPLRSPLRVPRVPAAELVDWLFDQDVDNNWSPVLSFARQLLDKIADPPTADEIDEWIDRAASYFEVADPRSQPLVYRRPGDGTPSIPALLMVVDKSTNPNTAPYSVRCLIHRDGRTVPAQLDDAAELDGPVPLDPDAPARQAEIALLIDGVLNGYLLRREQVLLCFILPDELLDHGVEHWAYPDESGPDLPDHPLGTELPVVVSLASRHLAPDGDKFKTNWQAGWERQRGHHGQPLADTWGWCTTIEDVRHKPKRGKVCLALTATPRAADDPYLRTLLGSGVTAAIWPRDSADAAAFKLAVETRLVDTQRAATVLAELPLEIYRWRIDISGDKDHLCHHLTLLWDDWAYRLPWSHHDLPGIDR